MLLGTIDAKELNVAMRYLLDYFIDSTINLLLSFTFGWDVAVLIHNLVCRALGFEMTDEVKLYICYIKNHNFSFLLFFSTVIVMSIPREK